MNAGLEDVRVLFSLFDKHQLHGVGNPEMVQHQRAKILAEYSRLRKADAYAINDLALQNYTEMRASVVSPVYKLRKWLEETLSVYMPNLGWQTKYSRVSFGNERYSEVIQKSERQGRLIIMSIVSLMTTPIVAGSLLAWYRWRRRASGAPTVLLKDQGWLDWLPI